MHLADFSWKNVQPFDPMEEIWG